MIGRRECPWLSRRERAVLEYLCLAVDVLQSSHAPVKETPRYYRVASRPKEIPSRYAVMCECAEGTGLVGCCLCFWKKGARWSCFMGTSCHVFGLHRALWGEKRVNECESAVARAQFRFAFLQFWWVQVTTEHMVMTRRQGSILYLLCKYPPG